MFFAGMNVELDLYFVGVATSRCKNGAAVTTRKSAKPE